MKSIDEYKADMAKLIKSHGFAMQGVFDPDGGPSFCYTVGAVEKVGAEFVCIATVSINSLHGILNPIVYEILKTGKINTDVFSIGLLRNSEEELRGKFVNVTDHFEIERSVTVRVCDFSDEQLMDIYGHTNIPTDFKIYQLLIADKNNILPDEPGYDQGFIQTIEPEDNV